MSLESLVQAEHKELNVLFYQEDTTGFLLLLSFQNLSSTSEDTRANVGFLLSFIEYISTKSWNSRDVAVVLTFEGGMVIILCIKRFML